MKEKIDEYMKALGYSTTLDTAELVQEYFYFKDVDNLKKMTTCAIMGLMKNYSKNKFVNREKLAQLQKFLEKHGKIISTPLHGDKYVKFQGMQYINCIGNEFKKDSSCICDEFESIYSKEIYAYLHICHSDVTKFRKLMKEVERKNQKENRTVAKALEERRERQRV